MTNMIKKEKKKKRHFQSAFFFFFAFGILCGACYYSRSKSQTLIQSNICMEMYSDSIRKVPGTVFSLNKIDVLFSHSREIPCTGMVGSIIDNSFLCISYTKVHFYSHSEYSSSLVIREILFHCMGQRHNCCNEQQKSFTLLLQSEPWRLAG